MLRWLMNITVILLVAVLAADYFHDGGRGYGFPVHPYVYYGVGALVAFMPVFWACTHVCGGLLVGFASGGVMDGLKLGVLLGLGMALAKLWPATLGVALGGYIGGAPTSYVVISAVAGVLLFALDKVLQYFWRVTADA